MMFEKLFWISLATFAFLFALKYLSEIKVRHIRNTKKELNIHLSECKEKVSNYFKYLNNYYRYTQDESWKKSGFDCIHDVNDILERERYFNHSVIKDRTKIRSIKHARIIIRLLIKYIKKKDIGLVKESERNALIKHFEEKL